MPWDQFVEGLAVVAPVVTAVLVDGSKTRTAVALIRQRQDDQREDFTEMERRQARHERDPAHARLRPW